MAYETHEACQKPRLRELLTGVGLKQYEVAAMAEVSPTIISNACRGLAVPSPPTCAAIAQALSEASDEDTFTAQAVTVAALRSVADKDRGIVDQELLLGDAAFLASAVGALWSVGNTVAVSPEFRVRVRELIEELIAAVEIEVES